jgi:hypothetical protein
MQSSTKLPKKITNEENAAHDRLMRNLRVMEAEATRRAEASVAALQKAAAKRKSEKARFFEEEGKNWKIL